MRITGYASVFGVPDRIGDVVRAGAFRASLARLAHKAPMLLEHDLRRPCGSWRAREDSRGLFVDGTIDRALPAGRAALRLIGEGLDGLSIGFRARTADLSECGRTLLEIDLLEVSIVALPMQPLARLTAAEATRPAVLTF